MRLPLVPSAILTVVYLVGYLTLSIVYHRRWDARLRAALGRRLGAPVGWEYHDRWHDPLSDATSAGYHGWAAQGDASLRQRFLVNIAHLAVLVLVGVGPIAVYLLIAFAGLIHPLALWAALFLFIPIFALFWAGRYRWNRT
ncbi:hypothetical protein ACWT_6660 [Actinoplanes sp. SE50]|uniref:hypothetical protein n=1 Tax=unclassified Actinoplanes TaxID=2626549 RepID=UPI00023ECA2E|nr:MULTISPECIES: hypothetical protein [unclassified Actinoplanes]AEV87672.1 hypothetical protein ACPL_6790 [Actinoplanes sp. SE50/110]ATO86075.1 hypothetical protein ACWT_6660 [Actinoplanes sp. SE50]SLM03489.1 hypothetical protein ACSP50_6779 [Actinoplanes sp. SE50/110]